MANSMLASGVGKGTVNNIMTGPNYYISASGSNAAVGTDSAHPWLDLTNLNGKNLAAGVSVLFHAGDTFTVTNGAINVNSGGPSAPGFSPNAWGVSGNPVTIGAYGIVSTATTGGIVAGNLGVTSTTGFPATNGKIAVQIQYTVGGANVTSLILLGYTGTSGGNTFTGLTLPVGISFTIPNGATVSLLPTISITGDFNAFNILDCGSLTFSNLILKGDNVFRSGSYTPGAYLVNDTAGDNNNITISGCIIQNFANGGGVALNSTNGGSCSSVTVTGCYVTGCVRGVESGGTTNNITLTNNLLLVNLANGVFFGGPGTNLLISGCYISGNGFDSTDFGPAFNGGFALEANLITNILIQSNWVETQGFDTGGDSGGISLNGCTNCVTQFNLFRHAHNQGIDIGADVGNFQNNVYRFNLLLNNGTDATGTANTANILYFGAVTSNQNCFVYNNTMVQTQTNNFSTGLYLVPNQPGGSFKNFQQFNNIFYDGSSGSTDTIYNTLLSGLSNFTFDHNCYFNPATISFLWNNVTKNSVAAWGQDAHAVSTDPLLISPTGDTSDANYRLQKNPVASPCLGAGISPASVLGSGWWDPYGFASIAVFSSVWPASARDYFNNSPLPIPVNIGAYQGAGI